VNRDSLKTIGFVGMIIIGAASVLLPVLVATLLAFVAAAQTLPLSRVSPLWASLAALSALLGVWLVAQGIGGLRKRPSPPFRLPSPGLWIALFLLAAGALAAAPGNATLAGVASVLAALLPGLALLSFASRRLADAPGPATTRQIAAQTGAALTISLWWSMFWEIVALVVLAAIAGILLGATSGGLEGLEQLTERWSDPSFIASGEFLRQPAVLAFLLVLLAVFVPVIEEIGKLLAVGMLALARRPSRAQAVMWGITCGATFSVYEAAFANPFSGTGAMIAVLRVGALLVHCCAASLTALGLYEWISQRRARYFFLSLGLSMGLHSAWNALAIVMGSAMVVGGVAPLPAGALTIASFGLLSLGAAYILFRITGRATTNNADERE
jgi:hypothetical protein